MDLDFSDCFGRENSRLITEEIGYMSVIYTVSKVIQTLANFFFVRCKNLNLKDYSTNSMPSNPLSAFRLFNLPFRRQFNWSKVC